MIPTTSTKDSKVGCREGQHKAALREETSWRWKGCLYGRGIDYRQAEDPCKLQKRIEEESDEEKDGRLVTINTVAVDN